MDQKHLNGVGLALAGGGWRAFSQVAALKSMEQNSIAVGAVAGTSMGALVATLVAAGLDSDRIAELLLEMDKAIDDEGILKGMRWHLINAITKVGFLDSAKLLEHVARVLEKVGVKTFDDLEMPLAICTVDVITGELVVFTGTDGYFARTAGSWQLVAGNQDLATCIACSAAYPMVVQPMHYMDRTFVDGGCRMNLPTPLFDRSSVDAVVGVHMLHTYPAVEDLSVMNVMNKCMNYGSQQLEILYAQAADVAVNIPVDGMDTFKPGTGPAIIEFARAYLEEQPVDWTPAKPSFWNMARRAGIDAIARLLRAPQPKNAQERPEDLVSSAQAAEGARPVDEAPEAAQDAPQPEPAAPADKPSDQQ